MRRTAMLAAVLALATIGRAGNPPRPDYSREALMPLSGTRQTATSQLPDPFALSGVSTGGQALREEPLSLGEQRELRAELKRIRRLDRRK